MFNVDLSTGECGGRVVVGLRGELDVADAVRVAAWLAAIAAGRPQVIVDLAGLEFIDSSGVAALARGRKLARQAGGDMLLAAPRQQVLRVLAAIRLTEAFHVHPSVDEAAGDAARARRGRAQPARTPGSRGASCHGGVARRKSGYSPAAVRGGGSHSQGAPVVILGVILLIIGFVAKIAILWTIGIIVVVVGAILAVLGMAGHAVGGRRHYF